MTVEILFPEVCGLYGDGQNATYLQASLPNAKFVFTKLTDVPYFAENDPDFIYIGSMTEETQRRVIKEFLPYRTRIAELIDKGTPILATGNAGEIFCKHIAYITEESEIDALDFFDLTVKTDLFDRYNGKVLGEFENMQIVGFRSQFSFLYGDNTRNHFVKCTRGVGINRQSKLEGMRKNNLICTQILGPILPLNPLFCEYILRLLGSNSPAAYREAAVDAYEQHLKGFTNPSTVF